MAIYYEDLVKAGVAYQPPTFGQNATPGWADATVYAPPIIVVATSNVGGFSVQMFARSRGLQKVH